MSRLTNKDDRGRYYTVEEKILIANEPVNPTTTWITNNENRRYGSPIEKLGKLEDLEEQLGCPLEVVFKALDKGFYIDTKKVEKEPSWEKPMKRISLVGCPKYFRLNLWYKTIEVDRFGHYLEIWLEDYKKTWWLKEDKSE